MSDPRVHVVIDGQIGTVPVEQVDQLPEGARVMSDQEIAQARVDAEYAKKSGLEKALGVARTAAMLPAGPLYLGQASGLPPELSAYGQGVRQGLSAGTYEGLVRQAVTKLAGEKAGAAYEQQSRDLQTASPTAHLVGEGMGMLGGAALGGEASAAKAAMGARAGLALPSAGIGAIGNAVEGGVARALGGVAARGAAGRALATGASLGAQGLVEGALYGAAQQVGENMLGNADDVGDKVFAATGTGALYGALGGALLGAGGSLAKSGAQAVAEGVGRGIARMGTESAGKTALREAADRGLSTEAVQAERAAKAAGQDLTADLSTKATRTLKDAADSLAFDALGTTRKIGDKINKQVPGGTKAVGEYINREILKTVEGDVTANRLLTGGRADELLPLIDANRAAKGQAIGDIVASTPARVKVADVFGDAQGIYKKMLADPTQIQGAEAFRQRVAQTFDAFRNAGQIADDGTMALSDLYYARAKLEGVAHEMGRKTAAEASVKDWLRDLDSHLVNKLDEAAQSLGKTGEKEKLLSLKRDYQLASWAQKAAEDGSNRIASNNIFGLREGIAAGVGISTALGSNDPTMGLLGAGATALGGRFLRQRGAAAGALLLSRMAEAATIRGAIQAVDAQVARSSKGLLMPAKPTASAAMESAARDPVKVARRATDQITRLSASPEAVTDRTTNLTQGLATVAPNVAGKVASNMTRALAFLNSKLPPNPQVDPLAPAKPRSWTQTEAERFARYVEAADNPMGVLEDFERGKVTPEAVETLRVLTPTLYRDLQVKTLDSIAQQLATGKQVTLDARLRLGTLLGVEADPSQNPRVRTWLQGNVADANAAAGGKMQGKASGPVPRPIKTKTQYSAFDRLSESGPGRR